jgi:prophage tail gpP-like protein
MHVIGSRIFLFMEVGGKDRTRHTIGFFENQAVSVMLIEQGLRYRSWLIARVVSIAARM